MSKEVKNWFIEPPQTEDEADYDDDVTSFGEYGNNH